MGAANMVGGGLNMVGGGLNMVGGGLNEGAAGGVGTSRSPSFCINFAQIFRRAPRAIYAIFSRNTDPPTLYPSDSPLKSVNP